GGVAGGQGSSGGGDGSGGGSPARAGTSLNPAQNQTIAYTNTGNGSVAIQYVRGPEATSAPSFTDSSKAFVGQTWVPNSGTWSSPSNTAITLIKKVWQVSNDGIAFTDVNPAVSENYTTTAADVGKYFRYAVTQSDANGTTTATSGNSLQVTAAPVFTAENPTGSSAGTLVNTALTAYTFAASGYRNVYSISSGALPAGISLNSSSGILSGTPTASGTFTYKVKVTNDAGSDETVDLTMTIGRAPVFTSDDSVIQSVNRVTNPIRVGSSFPNFVFVADAFPSVTYELKTDSVSIPDCGTLPNCAYPFETRGLPDGLAFNPATATLSGTPTKAGAYVFAIRAANSLGSALDVIHMTIAAKAPAGFALSSDKNSVTIVQNSTVTATITASGGSGNGAYSMTVDPASTSICSITSTSATTAVMTVIAAGNCVINGTKAADGGFGAARSSITIPVNKAPQTAALIATSTTSPVIYGVSYIWVNGSGGNGTGAFSWTVNPTSAAFCSVTTTSGNSLYLAITGSGSCSLTATKAGDAFFQPQSTQVLVLIEKAAQSGFYLNTPGAVYWNASSAPKVTLTTGGGQSSGAVSYAIDSSSNDICSLDSNYKSITSAPVTWTIYQISQPALAVTAVSSVGAPINNGSSQNPYIAQPTAIATLSVTGGAGTGSFGYTTTNGSTCLVAGAGATAYVYMAATGSGLGWCYIAVTKAADVNYLEQTTTFYFHVGYGTQDALVATVDKPTQNYVATTISDPNTAAKSKITLSGGLGTGAISYTTSTSSVCSVDNTGLVTSKTAGSCVVSITKAGDANYNSQTISTTIVFNKLNQSELVSEPAVSNKDFTWSPRATIAINTTGGAGTGAVTYAVDPQSTSVCSVNTLGLITSITAGICSVTVTKAADTNYNVTTDKVSVTFNKVNAPSISLSASPSSITYTAAANKNTSWVTVAGGGNSTGAFTFYIDPLTEEYCSISSVRSNQILVSGNLAGLCIITVVQAADVNYFEQRTQIGVTINKMAQNISATSQLGTSVSYKDAPNTITTINVTGQVGTGSTKFVVDPANTTSNCSVDQSTGNVTATTVGTCRISVSRDGDDNVLASNTVVINLTISKVSQATITLSANSDFRAAAPGANQTTSALTIGIANTGTGNFTKIVSATPSICTITGGGDSTLATPTFTPTLNPSITVTAVKDGTCTLTYSKLGDNNYNAAINNQASFNINKASQADISTSITAGSATMPFVASPKATATITGAGGTGTGAFNFTIDPTSSAVCSVNATTGVVTNINAGTCLVIVKRLGDTNFAESVSKTVTINFTKIDQVAFNLTPAKSALKATTSSLDTTTLSTSGGSGTGAVTYAIDPASATICSLSGITVTGLTAGECTVIATKAADTNYNLATATTKLTITKGTQATLSGYWVSSPMNFDPSLNGLNYLQTSGGAGSGDLVPTIDASSSAVCVDAAIRNGVPSQITVRVIGDGVCTVRVYKLGGAAWDNSNTITQSFTVNKISQNGLSATASRTSLPFFDAPAATFTVTATGGNGTGALSITINPASVNICADSTSAGGQLTIRTIGVGVCYFTVTKATSTGYNAVTSNQVAVTITKGTQAPIVVSASPSTLTYAVSPRATSTITISGGSGNGAQTVTVDSGSSAVCSYDAATKVVTAIRAGKCDLTVSKAAGADGLFNAATGKLSITVNKIPQARLNLTAVSPNLLFNESPKATTVLNVSGGTGNGAVSYSIEPGSSSVCSLSVENQIATVTANYFGYCVVNATKAGDANYAEATATVTVRIAQPGTSIFATVPSTTVPFVAAPNTVSTVTVTGSKADDLLSYSVDNASKTICSVAGNGPTASITSLAVGLCNVLVINVSKAADGTLIASSATVALTITKGVQTGVTVTPAEPSVYFATPAATNVITVAGGLATGVVSASVDSGSATNCSISVAGNKITMTALKVGDCVINVTKAGNSTLSDYTTSLTVPILKTKQANLIATSNPSSLVYTANPLATATISTTGGSGNGEVTYKVDDVSTSVCEVTGNKVTALTGGDCVITVTKSGGENYSDASVKLTINIAKGTQAALSVTAEQNNLTYDAATTVSTSVLASGGSGSGEITYQVSAQSSAICSVNGSTVTVIRPGNCIVVATKAADAFFNAASASTTIAIAKANQANLIARTANGELVEPLWNAKNTTQIVITGGNGYGSLQLTNLTASICNVALVGQRVNVTGLTPGECKFTVTKDTDYAFLASAPLTHTVTVSSAKTDLTVKVSTLGDATAGKNAAIEISVLNNGQAKAAGATVKYSLPTGITVVSPLPSGCTLSSSTEISCSTTRLIEPGAKVTFTVLITLAGNLVGGQYTQNGKVELSSVTPDDKLENNTLTGQDANFIVNRAPTAFSRTTLINMQTGKVFTDQISAVGFPTVRYTIVEGDLPAGLTLNEATGEITGIPTGVGNYSFTVSAYNPAGSVSQLFSGSIAPAPFVTTPGVGFAPNTVPAGTKVAIGGINLNLITSAILGGKTVTILTKTATQIVIQVPNATQAGEVPISLVYAQGTLEAGSFTYTGVAKKTPVLVLNAGAATAGAGEAARTLTTSATAEGIEGELEIPLTYISRTPAVCSVSANKLSFVTAGTCTLAVSSAAGASFNAATSANVSLTVTKSSQSLVIVQPKDTVPPTATTDSADGFDLEVTATSGLTPQFVSATPTICDVTDDGHVTGLALGKCVVTITQAGDARFAPIAATQTEFTITADPGTPAIDNGDPLRPTSLAGGALTKMGDVGFTWNKKLGALSVETYGIWIGKINAVSEFTIAGKNYKCSVDFGILKAMPSKTAAQLKAAMAKKVFKASAPFCNIKTEAAAFAALKKGFAGLQVKVTITRFRMYPTTYKPINAKTKKPITTQIRTVYLTLG
ncbi:MAG: hypothetical protein EBZ61_05380, partial [Micrococcales bacterium]|nr:hypothetical protein [Micrococcales bacterium]